MRARMRIAIDFRQRKYRIAKHVDDEKYKPTNYIHTYQYVALCVVIDGSVQRQDQEHKTIGRQQSINKNK